MVGTWSELDPGGAVSRVFLMVLLCFVQGGAADHVHDDLRDVPPSSI